MKKQHKAAPPQKTGAFVKIPNAYIGMLADGGRSSIYALYLLVLKLAGPSGHVLNVHYVQKRYGIGWRSFAAGIRLMKARGVLDRRQNGCQYATEELLPVSLPGFVPLPRSILRSAKPLDVAFVLVVLAAPGWQPPIAVAKRMGIKSRTTVRRLVTRLADAGFIAVDNSEGKSYVARPTAPKPINGGATNSGMVKNGETQEKKKEFTEKKENNQKEQHTTLFEGLGLAEANASDIVRLVPWTNSVDLDDLKLNILLTSVDPVSLATWNEILDGFSAVPDNVRTRDALKQVAEIVGCAFELCCELDVDNPVHVLAGFGGVAAAIASWCSRPGRVLRSLGVIAKPLLNEARYGSASWALEYPSARIKSRRTALLRTGERLIHIASHNGLGMDDVALLSTPGLEDLARLCDHVGPSALEEAVRSTKGSNACTVIRWRHFEQRARMIKKWD